MAPLSEGRVTTRELADILTQLATNVNAIATGQQQLFVQQQELASKQERLAETVALLSKSEREVMEDLERKIESPEQVRTRLMAREQVALVHSGEQPRTVTLNGARFVIQPGLNTVPKPIAQIYRNGIVDEQFAQMNAQRLQSAVTYEQMEQARQIGR
jgi:hypothetical protein